jgi:hypothetical protein
VFPFAQHIITPALTSKLQVNRQNNVVTSKDNFVAMGPHGIGNPFVTPKVIISEQKDLKRDVSKTLLSMKSGFVNDKPLTIHIKRHS